MKRRPTDVARAAAASPLREACARIRQHLEHGAPWDACDAFRQAFAQHPHDAELFYWGALAHARAGAAKQAHALLDEARAMASEAPERLSDILSLRGRLWKDRLHRAHDTVTAREMAERARNEYLAAYALRGDPYPGINAATLSLLLGDRPTAEKLAREISAALGAQLAPRTCWDHATSGEAELLLGQFDRARTSYAAAYAGVPGNAGSVATMRRQVRLLARVLPEAAGVLDLLPAPAVLAFAGHLADAPDRATPRFPAGLELAVTAEIRRHLAGLNAPIVYASAACGADLIAIEVAIDLGVEVNIVLPFNRDDFVRTSVAVGGAGWTQRFDDALTRATRVIHATEESHLGDDVLFEHAAMLVEGLAALRAAQLETAPSMLCVIDSASVGHVGGTRRSFDRWGAHFGPPDTIELSALRSGAPAQSPAAALRTPVATPPSPVVRDPAPVQDAAGIAARPHRTLKTLLFADFAGYSRLHDAYAPLFQGRFWKIVADEFEASSVKPLMANSWGDAIYVVFEAPVDGAEFALRLLASMHAVDWTAAGLADTSQIRIALHAGPVFSGFDPIMGRNNFFGSSVTRTARIEPVTPPGMVYASEAFAATLAATGRTDFALEYIGELALAKGYGDSRIYRLDRR
ncbi:MAG: adenylate/guanylate cyclase domain-containing protein [Betaproteobacteria bacterium]